MTSQVIHHVGGSTEIGLISESVILSTLYFAVVASTTESL
jgi:hypothetical protein